MTGRDPFFRSGGVVGGCVAKRAQGGRDLVWRPTQGGLAHGDFGHAMVRQPAFRDAAKEPDAGVGSNGIGGAGQGVGADWEVNLKRVAVRNSGMNGQPDGGHCGRDRAGVQACRW